MQKLFPILTALALLTGCAYLGFGNKEPRYVRFKVNPSPLDTVSMVYFPRTGHESGFTQCRIDIEGGGTVELRAGTSERVLGSFWTETDADNWDDVHYDRMSLRKDEITILLQRLVDFGAFPEEDPAPPTQMPARPYMILHAQIGRHACRQNTRDPHLLYIADLLLKELKVDNEASR